MSSATDEKIKEGTKGSGTSEPKPRRANPVVLEAPVSVAGARPASSSDKRELFTEDTTTVLVFKGGAVIQLSAAIAVGQLLFLTDKRSKREMVCQVVHKRNHRPTSCYVELEFTEPAENFWDVSFPEHEEMSELPPSAEVVEAQETTEDDRSEPLEAPKTEDVAQLKGEVEALKAQLRALKQEKQAGEESQAVGSRDAQAKKLAEAEAAARAAVEASAQENAERMDREARERAARMAERARQHLQAQNGEPKAPAADFDAVGKSALEAPASAQAGETKSAVDLDSAAKAAAEEKEAARKAAEAEEAARAVVDEAAKQSDWAKDEGPRKASEEARKWEQDAIEAERWRRQEEQHRRESAEQGEQEPERAPEPEPDKPAPTGGLRIAMKLPSAAASEVTPGEAAKTEGGPATAGSKESIDPMDELLPKPALDFTKAPKGLDPNDPYNIYRPMRRKAGWLEMTLALVLVVVLVGGGGYAWYWNWLPFFHHGPKSAAMAKPGAAALKLAPAAAAPAASGSVAASGSTVNPAENTQPTADGLASTGANGATTAPTPAATSAEASGGVKSEAPAVEPEEAAKPPKAKGVKAKASSKKDSTGKAASAKSGKNHGKAETSSESKPKAQQDMAASDAPLIPAKLVRAVPPVYPPDAMRGYITGDVKIEAVVDADGRVGAMNVLVGPAALRQAAMDALKQYEYEPATQGEKTVASKVTVTIKFWFDP